MKSWLPCALISLVMGCDSNSAVDCEGTAVLHDSSNGLCWQNPSYDLQMTFEHAVEYCDWVSTEGYEDWRLPDIDDLRSLLRGCKATESGGDCRVGDGCGYEAWTHDCQQCVPFGGPGSAKCYWGLLIEGDCDLYWSSSRLPDLEESVWLVNFNDARVENHDVTDINRVRCVRD